MRSHDDSEQDAATPKGKNFSAANVTGKRKASDFYETPFSMTEQLLQTGIVPRGAHILEPAAGAGAIVNILEADGHQVTSYDLSQGFDFFDEQRQFDVVLTNPPYAHADAFIKKAKAVARQKVVLLLRLSYLHGVRRYRSIWTDTSFPLASVNIFTRYPMLGDKLRDDGKYRTGMIVYAWYVWDRKHQGEPVIRWIDNNEFVLRQNDVADMEGELQVAEDQDA